MDTIYKAFGVIVVAFLLIGVVSLIVAYPVLWMTNYLFPPSVLLAVFGVAKITFWRALALSFLCATLFKSSQSNKS